MVSLKSLQDERKLHHLYKSIVLCKLSVHDVTSKMNATWTQSEWMQRSLAEGKGQTTSKRKPSPAFTGVQVYQRGHHIDRYPSMFGSLMTFQAIVLLEVVVQVVWCRETSWLMDTLWITWPWRSFIDQRTMCIHWSHCKSTLVFGDRLWVCCPALIILTEVY